MSKQFKDYLVISTIRKSLLDSWGLWRTLIFKLQQKLLISSIWIQMQNFPKPEFHRASSTRWALGWKKAIKDCFKKAIIKRLDLKHGKNE